MFEDIYKEFGLTVNGFLPSQEPLQCLPNTYYDPWEVLIKDLPGLLRDGSFRGEIDNLAILSVEHLQTEDEYRRAYVILGFFTHAYIWGGETASEVCPSHLSPVLVCSSG